MNLVETIQHELNKHKEVAFEGYCHDCDVRVQVLCTVNDKNEIVIEGGAAYKPRERVYLKCDECFVKAPILTSYQECEVYSRVVGYLRPVGQWNKGKKAEYEDRKEFTAEWTPYDKEEIIEERVFDSKGKLTK